MHETTRVHIHIATLGGRCLPAFIGCTYSAPWSVPRATSWQSLSGLSLWKDDRVPDIMNMPNLLSQSLAGGHFDCLQLFLLLQTVFHIFVHKSESACRKYLEVALLVWACVFLILIGTTKLPHEAQAMSTRWKVFHDQTMNLEQCSSQRYHVLAPLGAYFLSSVKPLAGPWSTSKQNKRRKPEPCFLQKSCFGLFNDPSGVSVFTWLEAFFSWVSVKLPVECQWSEI